MLTSYIAIAKGDVPIKHWRRLSRAQLQKDGYRGLASWTGTMFEYLMPELFLPFYRGSLLYESGRFCLYAQKRRVFAGKPWGISESAFYSLDGALNYRYKANGCAALALKRGQDSDMVISPYSSFLALALDPHGAAKNLRRLESFGAAGRFGFMEALDFTPARCRRDAGEKVRCYMAHHIGMSVISAANAACEGAFAAASWRTLKWARSRCCFRSASAVLRSYAGITASRRRSPPEAGRISGASEAARRTAGRITACLQTARTAFSQAAGAKAARCSETHLFTADGAAPCPAALKCA